MYFLNAPCDKMMMKSLDGNAFFSDAIIAKCWSNPKPSNIHGKMEVKTVLCEFCEKEYTEKTIIMHISKSNQCKLHYGSRFLEMKRTKNKEKVQNWRQVHGKEKELSRQRELYAKKVEKENLDFKKRMSTPYMIKRQENWAKVKQELDKQKVSCENCKKKFMPKSINKHIGSQGYVQ